MIKLQWILTALLMIIGIPVGAVAQTYSPTGAGAVSSPNASLPGQNANPLTAPGAPMNPIPTNPAGLPANNGSFGTLSNPTLSNPTMPGSSTMPGSTIQPPGGSTSYPR